MGLIVIGLFFVYRGSAVLHPCLCPGRPYGTSACSLPVGEEPAHQVEAHGHVALVDVFVALGLELMEHGFSLGTDDNEKQMAVQTEMVKQEQQDKDDIDVTINGIRVNASMQKTANYFCR